jgi:outer membrane cobalamin receptor
MYVSTVLYQDQQDLQWKKLGGYPVINAGLLKKFKEKVSIFVSIDNMLDKNYETEAHFPMPGISVNMGLKMEI